MVKSYTDIFNARGHSYNEASRFAPKARWLERQLLIDRLASTADCVVLDAPAGGGYLAAGIAQAQRIYCVEPSQVFAKAAQNSHHYLLNGSLEALPVQSKRFNRLASLAGLHHLHCKQAFFDEAYRVLNTSGILAVADVQVGTASALFLNDTVDRLTETGHQGMFLQAGEASEKMQAAGFSQCREELLKCPWAFDNKQQMVTFCTLLFGLVNTSPQAVLAEIENTLEVTTQAGKIQLEWSLVYAVGKKAS